MAGVEATNHAQPVRSVIQQSVNPCVITSNDNGSLTETHSSAASRSLNPSEGGCDRHSAAAQSPQSVEVGGTSHMRPLRSLIPSKDGFASPLSAALSPNPSEVGCTRLSAVAHSSNPSEGSRNHHHAATGYHGRGDRDSAQPHALTQMQRCSSTCCGEILKECY